MINAHMPKMIMTAFFIIITFSAMPVLTFAKTKHSIRAGRVSPSNDKHRAPNSEMKTPNFGIATASKTIERIENC